MNFIHLKYAVEIEKTGSISKAAENLFMGQPNLSKAIKELENETGITIFIRTPNGVKPTEQGKAFLERAKGLISSFDNFSASYSKDTPRVAAFSVCVPRADYISNAFTTFVSMLDGNTEISLGFEEADNDQIIKRIRDFKVGMGIIRLEADNEKKYLRILEENKITHRILWEFDYRLLCSRESPLAKHSKVINEADLDELTEISFNEDELNDGKRRITVYDRGSRYDLLTTLADTYCWVSPTPKSVLEQYRLIQLNVNMEKRRCKDLLIFRKDYKMSRLDEQFLSELERVKEKIRIDKLN